MGSFHKKLALAQEMVNNALSSLRSAQSILNEFAGKDSSSAALESKLQDLVEANSDIHVDGDDPVYFGIFDGKEMITEDKETYPVPANYASKSKLIEGDQLKLTITKDGRFLYKQIGPIARRLIVGTLIKEEGAYAAMAEGKIYKLLLAAVTYHKAEVGDKLTLAIPEDGSGVFAAIENVLPPDLDNDGEEEASDESEELF